MEEKTFTNSDGTRVTIKKETPGLEENDDTLRGKFGIKRKLLYSWIFPILTFVVGDVTTTFYAVTKFGLNEMNPFILITGIHLQPILFTKVKLSILLFGFVLTNLLYFFLGLARLNDVKDYLYYMFPVIVGTVGLIVTVNNLIQILEVI